MNRDVLIHQLFSLKAQIDALIAMMVVSETPQCPHTNKISLSTMGGGKRWKCRDCGSEFDEHGIVTE